MVLEIVVAAGLPVIVGLAIVLLRSGSEPSRETDDREASPTRTAPTQAPAVQVVGGEAEIRRLVEQKQLIQAIRLHRELTGLGLRESKDAIDRLVATGSLELPSVAPSKPPTTHPGSQGPTMGPMDDVRQALREEKLIMAIKHYRDATGLGLKEAKDAVEKMRDDMKARGEIP
jgi:ribosomal protein L7/L12